MKDIPVGIYTVSLTGTVPVTYTTKEAATGRDVQRVRMERKVRRVRVPVVSGRETYLLVNLITGEVKDIPAEQLVAKARAYATQAKRSSSLDAWRNVIKYSEQALAVCSVEPAGAKELRDRARYIVQKAETEARTKREHAEALKRTSFQITYQWKMKLKPGEEGEAELHLIDSRKKKRSLQVDLSSWSRRNTGGRWRNSMSFKDEPFRTRKLTPGTYTIRIDMEKSFHQRHFIGRTDKILGTDKHEQTFTIKAGGVKKIVVTVNDLDDVDIAITDVKQSKF